MFSHGSDYLYACFLSFAMKMCNADKVGQGFLHHPALGAIVK